MKVQSNLFAPIKKRKKPVSLSGRTRKYLESYGYLTALVERSVDVPKFPGSAERFRNKFDCFGVFDVVAVNPQKIGTLYVQITDHSHKAEHVTKMLAAKALPVILQSQNRVQLHTWKAFKRRGVKLWNLRMQTAQLVQNKTIEFSEIAEHWFRDNMQEVDSEF